MRTRRLLLIVATLLICALPAFADNVASVQHQQPSLEKGFSAGKMYQFGNLDHVNLFNGNLNVTIPLGQSYSVGGGLSYNFTLMYSGNNWDIQYDSIWGPSDPYDPESEYTYLPRNVAIPYEQSNAGLGWSVSLGRMYVPHGQDHWVYESPDGGTHSFYEVLHNSGDQLPGDSSTTYSRDNTYIRRTVTRLADSSISSQTLEFPDGTIKTFDGQGRLTTISDRFSHQVTIMYDLATAPSPLSASCGSSRSETWTVTDSTGRNHYLYFVNSTPYQHVLCEANLAAFPTSANGRARYAFTYDSKTISRQYVETDRVSDLGPVATVPLLTQLQLPDNSTYGFAYDIGRSGTVGVSTKADDQNRNLVPNDFSNIAIGGLGSFSGHLVQMTLPTRGMLEWNYMTYSFPPTKNSRRESPPAGEKGVRTMSAGVAQRMERLPGSTTPVTTTYESDPIRPSTNEQSGSKTTVTDALGNYTKNYFSACRDCQIATNLYYGLPFLAAGEGEEDATKNGMYLSSKSFAANGTLLTSTYRNYESDVTSGDFTPSEGTYDFNRREVGQIAVEHAAADSSVALAVTTNYSNFDGLGHYRTTFTSDYNTVNTGRTVYQAFNRADTTVQPSIFDSGNWPNVTIPALTDPWILGRFSSITETRTRLAPLPPYTSLKTQFYFRALDGFLAGRRTLANGDTRGGTDLYVRFSDALTANAAATGDVLLEEYFGGDDANLSTTAALKDLNPGTAQYAIEHTYASGSLATTKYRGATFYSTNNTIDNNTGAVSAAYDTANVATTYDYDTSGRLLSATPTGGAVTNFAYTNATSTSPASVRVTTSSSTAGTVDALTSFDAFGRVSREWSLQPAGTWAVRETRYDALGRKEYQSQPEVFSSFTSTPAFTHSTHFTYDARGRVVTVLSPDNTSVTTGYDIDVAKALPGSVTAPLRKVSRTVMVGTGFGTDGALVSTAATTDEYYDAAGRLIQVKEPTGGALATYSYGDTAGHLTGVNMTAADGTGAVQTRSFTYDVRGFLQSEQQPELGGTVITYGKYDSRGHAHEKMVGNLANTEFDQTFEFDSAERIKNISARNPSALTTFRLWKEFTYGDNNADRSNGKVSTATRHNYLDGDVDLRVKESYTYGDSAGRLTTKVTELFRDAATSPFKSFSQSYSYNQLGSISDITYPTASGTSGAPPWNLSHRDYSNGALSGITGFASLQYGATGIPTQIQHTNGVVDTIVEDSNALPRPKSIKFETLTACVPASISTQPQNQVATSAGNATLTVVASGTNLSYQWYTAARVAVAGGTGSALSLSGVTSPASYYVVVYNACGRLESATATVSTCASPAITTHPASATITSGQSITLSVTATGTAPLTYQWYMGSGTGTPVGTGASYLTPALTSTASYWVRVSNSCGTADSTTAIVTVPLIAPATLTAVAGTSSVTVTWSASANADHYELWRRDASVSDYVKFADVYALTYPDSATSDNTAYGYKVRAVDAAGGSASPFSPADVATRMTFGSLTVNTTRIAASHIEELLTLVNRVRAAARSGDTTWTAILPAGVATPASNGLILRQHITSLRQAMNTALAGLGVAARTFTDPTLDQTIPVRLVHVTDLRNCAN